MDQDRLACSSKNKKFKLKRDLKTHDETYYSVFVLSIR